MCVCVQAHVYVCAITSHRLCTPTFRPATSPNCQHFPLPIPLKAAAVCFLMSLAWDDTFSGTPENCGDTQVAQLKNRVTSSVCTRVRLSRLGWLTDAATDSMNFSDAACSSSTMKRRAKGTKPVEGYVSGNHRQSVSNIACRCQWMRNPEYRAQILCFSICLRCVSTVCATAQHWRHRKHNKISSRNLPVFLSKYPVELSHRHHRRTRPNNVYEKLFNCGRCECCFSYFQSIR